MEEGGDDVVSGTGCSGVGIEGDEDGVRFRAVMVKLGFVNWGKSNE